jgi:hypothetical protein
MPEMSAVEGKNLGQGCGEAPGPLVPRIPRFAENDIGNEQARLRAAFALLCRAQPICAAPAAPRQDSCRHAWASDTMT